MIEQLQKYLEFNNQARDAIALLREQNKAFIDGKKKLQPGDVVEVIMLNDGEVHQVQFEGVVGQCVNSISGSLRHIDQQVITLNALAKDEKAFNDSINLLRYEVFARKKNGKASSKHLFSHPHNIPMLEDIEGKKIARRFDYAIRKKDGN